MSTFRLMKLRTGGIKMFELIHDDAMYALQRDPCSSQCEDMPNLAAYMKENENND